MKIRPEIRFNEFTEEIPLVPMAELGNFIGGGTPDKELIGKDSAKEVVFAINLNLSNLLDKLDINEYFINRPSLGISFDIPLDVLEDIFDFWLDTYKEKEAWEICLGLLKIRKKVPLSNLIDSGSLRGNSKRWAIKIEKLHSYLPNTSKANPNNEPMWK